VTESDVDGALAALSALCAEAGLGAGAGGRIIELGPALAPSAGTPRA
jgi:hypothetical protein